MLDYEIASIYYFIDETIEAKPYFNEQPEDVITPCVFYPCSRQSTDDYSLNAYATNFTMYVVFMDVFTENAYAMTNTVLHKLMKNKQKVRIVDNDGVKTDKHIRLEHSEIKKVENEVYEMKLSWKRYTAFDRDAVTKAQEIFINNIKLGG